MKFGVLGAGKMGSSIAYGCLKQNIFKKEDILISVKFEEEKQRFIKEGFTVVSDVKELYQNSDIVLLSVKPQQIKEILEELSCVKNHAKMVLSIMAGISTEYLKKYLTDVKMVRIMPNTPALIGNAMSAISFNDLTNEEEELVKRIFDSIGNSVVIKETQMNEVIPLNGSFPAYGYYFAKAFIDAGIKAGFTYEQARDLVSYSMIGTAKMILEAEKPIDELIKDVCSPGGTTIEGIYVFDNANLNQTVEEAFEKCVKRAYELGKKE